jgi:hypothetical protein
VNGRLNTHPHNVVDGQFVTEDYLLVRIDIDDGAQAGVVGVKVIKECGILTEGIAVVGIVHTHLVVSKEKQDTASYTLLKLGAALYICLFCKHSRLICFEVRAKVQIILKFDVFLSQKNGKKKDILSF